MPQACAISPACRAACYAILTAILAMANAVTSATNEDVSIPIIVGNVENVAAEESLSSVEFCRNNPVCPWNVPPIRETGCCPKEAGESCNPTYGLLCNVDMGYRCADLDNVPTEGPGTCKGPHNLTATNVKRQEITLEWNPFAQSDYPFEYSVMLTHGSFNVNYREWPTRECGLVGKCTIRRLIPKTTYLVRVATWRDIRNSIPDVMTETIAVTTSGSGFCEHNGLSYPVGESFTPEDEVEHNCTCLENEKFECRPRCPHGTPPFVHGCRSTLTEECRYVITCDTHQFENIENKLCRENLDDNEVRFDCRVCHCVNGQFECDYSEYCNNLSPRPNCKKVKEIRIPGQCCPEWDCEDECQHGGKSYSAGEIFISQECGLCQCLVSGQVECLSNCPPVEMVPPSLECPMPHIKRTGCCDTLHCVMGNANLFSYVEGLEALYTTSVSLTLSFETEPACEVRGQPSYCQYRIKYTNKTSESESHKWKNKVVHPVDIIRDDESASLRPIDLVTKDTAIVVDGRAFITLSGMQPKTEFFVLISQEEEIQEDELEVQDSTITKTDLSLAAMVVVKTRPLKNATSCFYNSREVQHGETVSEMCDQVCSCLLGEIVCHSKCEAESFIVAASLSCPHPRLEKMSGECCPEWKCYPAVSGCEHNNAFLRHGQVVSDGCRECVCTNSTVQCKSLCPPPGHSPRQGCELTNTTGHCCHQWSCPLEISSPVAVERQILLKFLGACEEPISSFKEKVLTKILDHVVLLVNCSSDDHTTEFCRNLKVLVACPDEETHKESRMKRSQHLVDEQVIKVYITLRKNYSSETDTTTVFKASSDIQKSFKQNFTLQLTNGSIIPLLSSTYLQKPEYICPNGFSYKDRQCVLSKVDVKGTLIKQVLISPVDLEAKTVTLQWTPLDEHLQSHIKSLHIYYRLEGKAQSLKSKSLETWRTSFTLLDLQPRADYVASLVAVTHDGSHQRWTLGETYFQTQPLQELQSLDLNLTIVTVSASQFVVYWTPFSDDLMDVMSTANVVYRKFKSNYVVKRDISTSRVPFLVIESLHPSTTYEVELVLTLTRGKTIKSSKVEVTTTPADSCGHVLILITFFSCLGLAAAVAIILLICCRYNKKDKTALDFVNKSYGVTLAGQMSLPNSMTASPS